MQKHLKIWMIVPALILFCLIALLIAYRPITRYVASSPRPGWLPKPRWIFEEWQQAIDAAHMDRMQALPPGTKFCFGEDKYSQTIDYHEKEFPKEGWTCIIERDEIYTKQPIKIPPPIYPYHRSIVIKFMHGRFRPVEWHLTKAGGKDIPASQQIVHQISN